MAKGLSRSSNLDPLPRSRQLGEGSITGVSGNTPEGDEDIAKAGAAVFR
jgi:hypothetical protein